MNTLFTGANKIYFSQVGSTITQAWQILAETPEEGTLIYTDHQYAGKGQRGNEWISSPYKNIALSVIYYPTFLQIEHLFYLNKVVSLAVQSTVQTFLPNAIVQVKWPNDILVNKKKIAGILIENQLEGSLIKSSIIGIGINVNEEQFPNHLRQKATSFFLHKGKYTQQEELISMLMEKLESYYLILKNAKKSEIDRSYLSCLYGYQETVMLSHGTVTQAGIILGVDLNGKLTVQFNDKVSKFDIKEVSFKL